MALRSSAGYRFTALLMPIAAAAILSAGVWQFSAFSQHNSIQQLGKLPANSAVHLIGVVVHADPSRGEVWIQDATGTVPLAPGEAGAKLRLGESVSVEGTVTPLSAAPAPALTRAQSRAVRHRRLDAAREAQVHARQAGALPANPRVGNDPPALVNAAPGVALAVTQVEGLYAHYGLLALPTVIFFFLWTIVLYLQVRRQNKKLIQASATDEAIRELSTQMRQLTQEATFNREIPAAKSPEVAPLAAGFNAMIAELQKRDGVRRDVELRLRRMTLMDDLTGLPNRRLLTDRLSQCMARARRDQSVVALLCVDLDDFKLVNDSYGHMVGDALLGQVAQRLRMRFRHSDTIARIGGDEFALVLDDLSTREEAHALAEEVQQALREPFQIGDQRVQTGARIGISVSPDAKESGQLLQQADCAMYAAKRSGKSRIVQFGDDLGIAARERLTLESELHHAIAKGEISLDYQPEVDFATNQIVRFEALARWTHPELGLILPAVFIPLAEESGVIGTLGSYIMERACTDAVTWQEIVGRPIQVGVNVSSVQFGGDAFFEEVADILQRTGLAPHLLQIELTESATMHGMERAADVMRRLKRLGVSVAVDDFGTGYSCLTYLPKLPFDTLKLDRSFVSEMMVRRETKAFVGSIVTLARDLDMKVIAEGIETHEQLRALRALGSDAGQGFLLGRPSGDPIAQLNSQPIA
jgi:diguanylate cyclase (GGDEF)-like protein